MTRKGCYNEGFEDGVKSIKPAEWSEEDEKKRRNLMSLLVNMRGDRITEETYQKYYPWLKSLLERFNFQPKQKWSEENEEIAKQIEEQLFQGLQGITNARKK